MVEVAAPSACHNSGRYGNECVCATVKLRYRTHMRGFPTTQTTEERWHFERGWWAVDTDANLAACFFFYITGLPENWYLA